MKHQFGVALAIATAFVACQSIFLSATAEAEDWTRFRGPAGSGVSESSVPLEWDADNVKWAVELPGLGSSCPIILGDKVFLTCYTGYGEDRANPGEAKDLVRHLICFNKESGEEEWRASVESTNDEDAYQGFIQDHGFASSTPVTDGEHVFVQFGKTGVAAFNLQGEKVWLTNTGSMSDPNRWGPDGPSPVLFGDLVIVNAGITAHKIIALNKADGTEAWAIEDEGFTSSWTTPIPVKVDDHVELVFNMPGKLVAVNPENGELLWSADSPIAGTTCASAVQHDGVVFAMGGRAGRAIAVRCGGSGDVSETHTVWQKPLQSGIDTPVIVDGKMYWYSRTNVICVDCESGDVVFEEELPAAPGAAPPAEGGGRGGRGGRRRMTPSYASPVVAGEHILIPMRSGIIHVVKPGSDSMDIVASNNFGEEDGRFSATPAISDGKLFVRSDRKLYCVGE